MSLLPSSLKYLRDGALSNFVGVGSALSMLLLYEKTSVPTTIAANTSIILDSLPNKLGVDGVSFNFLSTVVLGA
jgi:hypothetical protein